MSGYKAEGAVRLTVVPVTLPAANDHIAAWHRHHGALETLHGGTVRDNKGNAWFSLAAVTPVGQVVAVATAGRPTNRNNEDGQTVEVLRVASDGTPNACSFLLGAVRRVAKEMGAARVITYTLESEPGTSLRAAGWSEEQRGITSSWTKGKGKARPGGAGNTIWREHMNEKKVRWATHLRDVVPVVKAVPTRHPEKDHGGLGGIEAGS